MTNMPPEDEDMLAGIVQLLMAGSNGLWWVGDADGDIELYPAGEDGDDLDDA